MKDRKNRKNVRKREDIGGKMKKWSRDDGLRNLPFGSDIKGTPIEAAALALASCTGSSTVIEPLVSSSG